MVFDYHRRMTAPLSIGTRRELFVDDTLIERMSNAELRLSHPERREVVFAGGAPWEDNTVGAYSLVQTESAIRLYYRAAIPDLKNEGVCILAMAESTDDGKSFHRPDLGLVEFQGSKHNNILWHGADVIIPPAFLDTNPACAPDARYKGLALLGWEKICASVSGDGLNWRRLGPDELRMEGTFDTINTAFWDSVAGCYRCYTRMFADPATGQPYPKNAIHWGIAVRAIQTSTSPDFVNWSPVQPLQYQDGDLETQMYTNAVTPCPGAEHIYIGFPNRFMQIRENVQGAYGDGCNDALFMCSRDGVHWTRYREAWVRPGLDQRNWTHRNNYPIWGLIQSSDTEWSMLISEHYMQKDGTPCQFRRLSIRPWGFASIRSGYNGGEVLTKPLIFGGNELRLNYSTSVAGCIQVEIQDPAGKPMEGFAATDMLPLLGDQLDAKIIWKQGSDLSALMGKPVRFRFVLKDADIFAMRTLQ
jgi:hypothetical protein